MEATLSQAVETEKTALMKCCSEPDFGPIYEEHAKAVYYLALRMLGDPAQAEDAAHDVFLKAFRALPEFRGASNVRTWLYRITINHCRNLSCTWHKRHVFTSADETVWETQGHSESPLRILEVKELGEKIQKTLSALPDEYRLILLLVADSQLSYDEIASLTDQSSDAVRGKLHRARKAFQQYFQKENNP